MGSQSHPHRVLCVCVCVCVSRCLWVCVIEADPLQLSFITVGYIRSCHAVSLVRSLRRLQCLECLRSTFTVRSGSAIPEPCCFLDSDRRTLAAHCFPALPASALREAPFLPTESSASAYGELRVCLRKLRLCPTEAPPLPYGKLRLVLAVYYFL